MNRWLTRFTVVLSIALSGVAYAQTTTPPDNTSGANLSGQWKGECNRCSARSFSLVLVQAGSEVTGTIKTEGTPPFGDSVKPIANVRVPPGKLLFEAKGDAGDVFYVELSASSDDKTLNGTGWYRNGNFGLWFTRASP